MFRAIDDILFVKNNVFTLTPVLMSFYDGCCIKDDNLFLSFIVFPMIFNEEWNVNKQPFRVDSTLEAWKENNRLNLKGLPSRMTYFRDITLRCLQYGVDMGWIVIERTTIIVIAEKKKEWNKNKIYSEQMINAYNFNKLLIGKNVAQIYSVLDIKEIWKQ